MKKINKIKPKGDQMRREYDFRNAVRGKFYKRMERGYTVQIHNEDGTTTVQHYRIARGTIILQPDVQRYFPDSKSVNAALRGLITSKQKRAIAAKESKAAYRVRRIAKPRTH